MTNTLIDRTRGGRRTYGRLWSLARRTIAGAALVAAANVGAAQAPAELSEADRAGIQRLTAEYLRTLNACAAEEYADLFAAGGYFESTFRGRVEGRDALIALVRSERHCAPGAKPRAGGGTPPAMMLRPTADGAVGTATLPNDGGGLEEHYVRTPQGWRFLSRIVFTAKELASGTGPGRGAK